MSQQITITKQHWGQVNGQDVVLFTLTNKNGMSVSIINRGATIQSILVPDRNGTIEDVIVGYDTWQQYCNDNHYAGTLVGRCANRIAYGKFEIDGQPYQLALNHGDKQQHQHHGGHPGLHEKIWRTELLTDGIKLSCTAEDGEAGYPGNLSVEACFTLSDDNELKLSISANTDQATLVNMTTHPYFNLSGGLTRAPVSTDKSENEENNRINGHEFFVASEKILELNQESLPTGELLNVEHTPFDFQALKALGQDINNSHPQLNVGAGYDHFFVFKHWDGQVHKQAELYEPESGRLLELFTDQPGLQVYSSNFMSGDELGKNGHALSYRCAFALEPQVHPDAPNHANFPSIIVRPDESYRHQSSFKFSTR